MTFITPKNAAHGFSLLELLTVIAVILILVGMLMPAMTEIRERVEKSRCMGNLRSLHVAAAAHVQDHKRWPQISSTLIKEQKHQEFARQWIAALEPYNIPKLNWICPTLQRRLNHPDFEKPGQERVDYIGMPFDSKEITPTRWPKAPWFCERADVHGNGQLIIFTDGSVKELKEIARDK